MPYAEAHGIAVHELSRIKRDGTVETLWGRLTKVGARSIGIPVRMSETGAPGTRSCTADFKIRVIAKWLKQNGATKDTPALTGLGISVDEIHRARTDSGIPYELLTYPLIDLRMNRQDCVNVIERAGIPVPGKSSCFFCPFHSTAYWARQQREEPELFARSVDLERQMNAKRTMLGKDPVWFHRALIPLDQVIVDTGQQEFDFAGLDVCEGGYCHT